MPAQVLASSPGRGPAAKPERGLSMVNLAEAREAVRNLAESLQTDAVRQAWTADAKVCLTCEGAFERACLALAQFLVVRSWVESHDGESVFIPSKGAFALYSTWNAVDAVGFVKIVAKVMNQAPAVVKPFESGKCTEAFAGIFAGCCALEGLDARQGIVPSLFTLDHALGWSQGWRFVRLEDPSPGVYHCELDVNGESRDRRWFIHAELSRDNVEQALITFEKRGITTKIQRKGSLYATAALTLCSLMGYEHRSLAV